MLEQLEIVRFQSHDHTLLEFDKGVNVILGESDVGKSSIIRSINWAINNRPTGDSFRSTFSKKPTEIAMAFSEGHFVRAKGPSFNGYNTEAGDLKALRTDVPDEVKDIHKMQDVNIQPQSKAYFLLDETPGQVAKEFNAVAGLEEMDSALQNVNSKIRQTNRNMTEAKELCDKTEQSIADLSWIEEAEKSLGELQVFHSMFEKKKAEYQTLFPILLDLEHAKEKLDKLPDTSALTTLESIFDLDKQVSDKVDQYNYLAKLTTLLSKQRKTLKRYDVLVELRSLNTDEISQRIDALNNQSLSIDSLLTKIDIEKEKLKANVSKLALLYKEAVSIEEQMEFCQTCGQLITEA